MKYFFKLLAATAMVSLLWAPRPAAGEEMGDETVKAGEYEPSRIIKKIEDKMRAKTNYSEMTMTIYNPNWPRPREIRMKGWEDREADKSFIRITYPPRDRGKAFLKEGYVFKVYIPTERENKPITIPPSLMLQPWMGSDFTRDDLVRESSMIEDYKQRLVKLEKGRNGHALAVIDLIPRPDAPVVWGKITAVIDVVEYLPVRYEYYDEDGALVRVMILSDIKEMGGRRIPARWEMISKRPEQEEHRTVLEINDIKFNVEIPPRTFTEKNLTRRDWE